jgi:peptidylprolyl isomerase
MGNYTHIGIALGVSIGLLVLMGWWLESRSTTAPALLEDETSLTAPLTAEELAVNQPDITNPMNRTATFTTNKGTFTLELFEDKMPITTGNFISLAESGFYNGTKFHRVIENFMIQGGDPNTKEADSSRYGRGGPGYTIEDEFVSDPLLTNVRGTIAMANTGQPNSGGSQFFINTVDNKPLDWDDTIAPQSKHPVFGRVIAGLEVVDAISQVETGPNDLPVEPVVIESVVISGGQ